MEGVHRALNIVHAQVEPTLRQPPQSPAHLRVEGFASRVEGVEFAFARRLARE